MATVVYTPPIKLTIPQPGLTPNTPHIVHPDLTCTPAKVGIPTVKGERKLVKHRSKVQATQSRDPAPQLPAGSIEL